MAEVQILLGTKDGAAHLPAQLQSYASQSLQDWSLLVSDDGSGDRTHEVLAEVMNTGCQMQTIDGPQRGAAANYLHLIENCDTDPPFHALSDQDDLWFPDRLERGVCALRTAAADHPAIYAARTVLIDHAGRALRTPVPRRPFRPAFRNALVQNILPGNTIMMNRSALLLARRALPSRVPPFHDWWLYAVMAGAGARIVVDAQAVLAYRQHPGGLLGAHAGAGAGLSRMGMVLNGTWLSWLDDHHAALTQARALLEPENRAMLNSLMSARGRIARAQAYLQHGVSRQGRIGGWSIGRAALAGRA